MLLFKKKFLPAIRSGQKRQTLRFWKWRHMRAGQRSYIPGVGHILVTAVEEVRLEDLTEADAHADGFASLAELKAELEAIYPTQQAQGRKLFRVLFELAPREAKTLDDNSSTTQRPKRRTSRRKA
ncbi:MAG: ASCH domain-containing protein [Thermoguttaceae bacterium]|nr:ASCH domain-containing protein [Thermoguttaceae bacterium]MDW8078495.1 ASCH domain-containing protein [Thermoguttaceae bacterium]